MKKTAEELMAMAEENGLKLSPEEAEEIAKRELTDEDLKMINSGSLKYNSCSRREGYECSFIKNRSNQTRQALGPELGSQM